MIKLYDSNDVQYGFFGSLEQALEEMASQILNKGFKSYYSRYNLIDKSKAQIDYGSHTHFFFVENTTGEDVLPFLSNKETVKPNDYFYEDDIYGEEPISNSYKEIDFSSLKNLSEMFVGNENIAFPKKEEVKPQVVRVIGVDNVAKVIEALTHKNGLYEFKIWTDDFQAMLDSKERSYTIEIADRRDSQKFIFDSEENW
jgi:hypothetical protein